MLPNRLFYLLIVALLVITACAPQIAAPPEPSSAPPETQAQSEPITLRLAVADGEGAPSEPYVLEFIEQVKTLSDSNITVEPIWDAGSTTEAGFEVGVVQLVKEGQADLGLAASRAFDNENITSFQALQAPFLITNDALSKGIATQMLEGLSSAGAVGLTMWPEDLRHPFSIVPDKPILSPQDFEGVTVQVVPSVVSNLLIETLGGNPIFDEGEYQAAESGLRQGAFLTGTPTATGNVRFFAKFQVLFGNLGVFEKLSEEQRAVLRDAAAATQEKAIAEHPSEADAAKAWCADGGTIVISSDEQVAAFESASQPVFDKIEQDPINAELIAAIRELKAKIEPAPGAEACEPEDAQLNAVPTVENEPWSTGLPPNGIWQVELTADDFIKMGALKSTANDMAGVYTWTFQDGKAKIEIRGPRITVSCMVDATLVGDAVRLQNVDSPTCDGNSYDDVQWRLDADGLIFHLVSTQAVELKAMYESKPWQKVE
jgi:TRAP-type transport system periplasmic protein